MMGVHQATHLRAHSPKTQGVAFNDLMLASPENPVPPNFVLDHNILMSSPT